MRHLTRRDALALGAGATAFAIVVESVPAFAAPKEAADEIAKFSGG